jgi:hypothetical protein
MQAAFLLFLIFPPPASGSDVLTFLHRPRTARAPDTNEPLGMQRIHINIVFFNIFPYLNEFPVY